MATPTIRGIYRKGRVKLLEPAPVDLEGPVLVVFLKEIGEKDERQAWLNAARKAFLKGYTRRDAAYDVSTPFDRVAHLIGCVHGGPPDLSKRTGRRLSGLLRQAKAKRR